MKLKETDRKNIWGQLETSDYRLNKDDNIT